MVELTLPKNSKIRRNGKTFRDDTAAPEAKLRTVKVYRYDPDSGETPRIDSYDLDVSGISMVLDLLIKIKSSLDPTLSFRRLDAGQDNRIASGFPC